MITTQRTEALALIRERCVAANPEITELKFGCRVWIDDSIHEGEFSIWEYVGEVDTHSNQDTVWRYVSGSFAAVQWGNFRIEGKPYVIIGRPIRLADVLLAIRDRPSGTEKLAMHFTHGSERDSLWISLPNIFSPLKSDLTVGPIWNLRSDSLDAQDDGTLLFLANLLK